MRIIVFDVPAEIGGALSVLNEFYDEFKQDKQNEYIIVLSLPQLKETSNIKILRFPWIKKSWAHRIWFDYFVAPKLIKKYKVDKVLSLQNITIPYTKVYQSVFVHNALPFMDYRFSFNENKFLWIYQNVIGNKIIKSIKQADHVIVQTNWMKRVFVEQMQVEIKKIEVQPPRVNINVKKVFSKSKDNLTTFFYPANDAIYKNHKVIVDACLKLKQDGISNYSIIFTLNGNESKHISDLYKVVMVNNLPIIFSGYLTKSEVLDFYSKSILIFPSYIETVGLPLLEAKLHQSPILASECTFSHEILDGYQKVDFFPPFDSDIIKSKMMNYIL